MDISFISGQDKFNYRVCAIILSGNKILAMHDERSPYYYLPLLFDGCLRNKSVGER